MAQRNLKLTLEYDGSAFYGFQRQPRHVTVQEALEQALSKLFNAKTKIQAASGRTDTGVHARGQIVNVRTSNPIPCLQIQRGLNALLPEKIAILQVEEAAGTFHARYSALSKTYEYHIWNAPVRSPLGGAKAWHIQRPLNVKAMQKAARFLTGKHDFRSFCAANSPVKNFVRRVKNCRIRKKGSLLILEITANGFLYHMVRNIAGTLADVGWGKLTADEVLGILKKKDRKAAGQTAPPEGLFLVKVQYPRQKNRG